MRKQIFSLASLIFVGTAIAGCGSNSNSSGGANSTPPSPPANGTTLKATGQPMQPKVMPAPPP